MKSDPGRANAPARLRVLIVEDSEDDALLLLRELERGGYEPLHERVETPEAMRRALAEGGPWDVVLSDWRMPRFEAPEALAMFRATGSEAPFIIVSGKVGEELAVGAMKAGAHDYVMKGNLTRLCATVERGLEEARARRERGRVEKSLKESEERYRRLVELSPDAIIVHDGGEILFVNAAGAELYGVASPEELSGKSVIDLTHPDYREIVRTRIVQTQEKGERTDLIQEKFFRLDGRVVDVEVVSMPITYRGEAATMVVARDITRRKRAEEGLRRREAVLRAVAFAAECFLRKAASWEESIEEVLERLGRADEVSRVYVFENYTGEDGERWTTQRYEWVAPGVSAQIDDPLLKAFPYRAAGWERWEDILGRGEVLHGHVREFPEVEQQVLRAQDIQSIMVVPISVEGEVWGFIGFDECTSEREWSAAEIDALKAAAGTLGAAIGRTRAERALRESEERTRTVLANAPVVLFALDREGVFTLSEGRGLKAMGLRAGQGVGRSILDVYRDEPESLAHIRRALAGEEFTSVDDLAGPGLVFEVRWSPVRDGGSGAVTGVIGVATDITERKRAGEALAQSEERYRAVVEQAAEGIFLFDAGTKRIVETNPAFQRLLDYSAEELEGMRLYDLIENDPESVDRNVRLALEQGHVFVGERRYLRKDGSAVEVEVSGNVISYGGKKIIAAIVRDLTERVEAYQLLEERVTALARMAANLTVDQPMEATLDSLAARLVEASTAVVCAVALIDEETDRLRLTGLYGQSGEWVGALEDSWRAGARSPVLRAFHDHRPQLLRNARRFLLDDPLHAPVHSLVGEVQWDTVFIMPLVYRGRASGAIILGYEPGRGPSEDEVAFLKAVADQTAVAVENTRLFAEVRGKSALEERQRLARELHDSVSQALYGIGLGSRTARVLLDREGSSSRVAEWLEYVRSLAGAGLSEMRALIFELRPESLETEGLVVALSKQVEALQARHEIPVHATLGDEPDLPLETKEGLYRIAQEALHNTVKHARASRADLKLECDAADIALEVSDDGVGFDPEGSFPGHLGLKSMHERAARLGGTLRVESAPGKGTRIRAWIPPGA